MKRSVVKFLSYLLLVIFCFSCRGDRRRTIFEMLYPNILFDMPAGLTGSLPRVFYLDDINTNFQAYLNESSVDTSLITRIEPISATLSALDNVRFDFLREVSIRICPEGPEPCTIVDEVFYLDDLQNQRIGDQLRLLPTLVDVKPTLSQASFKMEVWFFFFGVSPSTIPIKLDLRFDAVQ